MKIAGVGDAIISRRVSSLADESFTRLIEALTAVDGAYVNFEMVTPRLPAIPEALPKAIRLAGPPWTLDELGHMGFNLFGLANNHAYDFSTAGLADTIDMLNGRQLAFSGAGHNLDAARMPCYRDTSAGRIAMINLGSTAASTSLAANAGVLTAPRVGINPLRFVTEYHLTADHYTALGQLDEDLGTAATTRALLATEVFPGPRVRNPDRETVFLGRRFVLADESRVATHPFQKDLDEISRWIGQARRSADVVIVGMHCHESAGDGINLDTPAEFIATAAHTFVDAGADVVFGHGPHRLRGVEIYQGRPIFYSLGNFMFMDDTFDVFDPDLYEYFDLGPDALPADLHDYREGPDGRPRGFHHESAFWEGALAICEFDERGCTEVQLVPVALDRSVVRSRRGTPRVADKNQGADILGRIQALSDRYGTTVEQLSSDHGPVGRVRLS